MRKKVVFQQVFAAFMLFFVISCTNLGTNRELLTPENSPTGSIKFRVAVLPNSPFAQIADSVIIKVSAENMMTIYTNLTITDSSVEGLVKRIPAGTDRLFEVFVYDSIGQLQYRGSAIANIIADSTISVLININRVSGSAYINGEINEDCTESNILFEDSFEGGTKPEWFFSEPINYWASYDSALFALYKPMSYDGKGLALVNGARWTNYEVSVDVTCQSSGTGWAVILVRAIDENNYYTFQIEPGTNYINFEKRNNGSCSVLRHVPYTVNGNENYRLSVKVNGTSAECFINGTLVITYSELDIPSGGAGLAGWHMPVKFDNFVVSKLQ